MLFPTLRNWPSTSCCSLPFSNPLQFNSHAVLQRDHYIVVVAKRIIFTEFRYYQWFVFIVGLCHKACTRYYLSRISWFSISTNMLRIRLTRRRPVEPLVTNNNGSVYFQWFKVHLWPSGGKWGCNACVSSSRVDSTKRTTQIMFCRWC